VATVVVVEVVRFVYQEVVISEHGYWLFRLLVEVEEVYQVLVAQALRGYFGLIF
jgi:hypothetical protein